MRALKNHVPITPMALKSTWLLPRMATVFGTKRVYDRIEVTFRAAAATHPDDPLAAMGAGYRALLTGRDELLLLLPQSFAAAGDPQVQEVGRRRYAALYRHVAQLSGADDEVLRASSRSGCC
jgi:hypothetical protein